MELSEALKEVVTTHQSSFSNFKLHYVVNPIDQGNYVLSLISVNIDMPYCNDPKVLVCTSSVLLCEFTCMAKKMLHKCVNNAMQKVIYMYLF